MSKRVALLGLLVVLTLWSMSSPVQAWWRGGGWYGGGWGGWGGGYYGAPYYPRYSYYPQYYGGYYRSPYYGGYYGGYGGSYGPYAPSVPTGGRDFQNGSRG